MAKQFKRMQDKLAATANDMTAEARALSGADMYWVSRDMVDVAAAAAATLPEWTPAMTAPAVDGGRSPGGAMIAIGICLPAARYRDRGPRR